jgi:hypothetical protein
MTNKSIVTAVAVGFCAFTLSTLPATPVHAEITNDCTVRGGVTVRGAGIPLKCGSLCGPGESQVKVYSTEGTCAKVLCCKLTTPSEPYATGETPEERAARHKTEAVQLKADCEAQRKLWDPATNKCNPRPVKNIGKAKTTDDTPGVLKAVRACRAKGPEYEYDVQAALCVQKAEKHDDKPKNNKKKKKQHDDDDDDDD